jgi:hypothetical protein
MQAASGVADFFANRYGGVENLKRTIAEDPVGFLSDASTVLTGGGTLAAKGAAMAGKLGGTAGKIAGAVGTGAQAVADVGAAIDPLTLAGKAAALTPADIVAPIAARAPQQVADVLRKAPDVSLPKAVGTAGTKIAQEMLGVTTGAGSEALAQAAKAGRTGNATFLDNLRGGVPAVAVVDEAMGALGTMQSNLSSMYKAGEGVFKNDPTVLNFGNIETRWQNFWDTVKTKSGRKTVGPAEEAKLQEIGEVINEWKLDDAAHTAEGLDGLKRRIQAIYPDNPKQSQVQRAVTTMSNAVKREIEAQAPGYAKLMKDYHQGADQIGEIEKALSLNPKASIDTQLRKLQSIMRNNVNTNWGARGANVDLLEQHGAQIRPALAGQVLNAYAPRGLARVGPAAWGTAAIANPWMLAAAPFQSPRLMGEAAYYGGKGAGALGKVGQSISPSVLRKASQGLYQAGRLQEEE